MDTSDLQIEFTSLMSACERDLLAYILTMVTDRHDALDILQETSQSLWMQFAKYDRQRPFGAWARRFAYVEVLRFRGEQQRRSHRVVTLSDEALANLADEYDLHGEVLSGMRTALRQCLTKLTADDFALIKQRYWDGVNIRLLAASQGKSESQAYSRLHRIRAELLECIERTMRQEGLE